MGIDSEADSLPPYTYVPGQRPHPISHPEGHLTGKLPELHALSDEAAIERGVTLFNNGYYWEAHEIWEQAWILRGRRGPAADLVKGLIKLAAGGVKCLEANEDGAHRHFTRALQLFTAINNQFFLPHFHKSGLISLATSALNSIPVQTSPSDGTPAALPNLKITLANKANK